MTALHSDHYRQVTVHDTIGPGDAGCCRQVTALHSDHYRQVTVHDTIGPGDAGCCRQVAALHSDHYRQVLLYMILLDQRRLAAVDRWLPCTVTTIDRFYCT